MRRLIPILASALSACGQLHPPDGQTCIDAPCVATINLPADIEGTPDTRTGTWGSAGVREVPYTFKKVPLGYRVRVLRIDGDMVSWPHGDVMAGKFAGVLWGATTTSSAGDVHLDYAAQGCLIYTCRTRLGAGQGAGSIRPGYLREWIARRRQCAGEREDSGVP